MTDRQKNLGIIGGIMAWCVLAVIADRYLIRDIAPWFSEMLVIKDAEIVVKPMSRTISWLGLSLVLVAPSLFCGLGVAIYRAMKKRPPKEYLAVCGLVSFWFLLIPIFVWIGDVIYRFMKGFLDDWAWAKGLVEILEGFILKGNVTVYSFKLYYLDAGLGAMAGLAVGIALLYKKGLWNLLKEKADA
jgi:hypothetical protein